MTKLLFLHYFKFTREWQENVDTVRPVEWRRYNDLLEKHGLKMLNHGTPFGNEYHWVGIIESEKGFEAWNAFEQEYVADGTSNAKYFYDVRTDIIRAQG
jgi:hypothetical protein